MQVLWLRYLTEINEKTREVPCELLEAPEINKAVTILEESAFMPEQFQGCEKFWDIISVEGTFISCAERRGIKEGILLVASNAKKQGLPVETISALTGLSAEEIGKL